MLIWNAGLFNGITLLLFLLEDVPIGLVSPWNFSMFYYSLVLQDLLHLKNRDRLSNNIFLLWNYSGKESETHLRYHLVHHCRIVQILTWFHLKFHWGLSLPICGTNTLMKNPVVKNNVQSIFQQNFKQMSSWIKCLALLDIKAYDLLQLNTN